MSESCSWFHSVPLYQAREMLETARTQTIPGTPEAEEIKVQIKRLEWIEQNRTIRQYVQKMIEQGATDEEIGKAGKRFAAA